MSTETESVKERIRSLLGSGDRKTVEMGLELLGALVSEEQELGSILEYSVVLGPGPAHSRHCSLETLQESFSEWPHGGYIALWALASMHRMGVGWTLDVREVRIRCHALERLPDRLSELDLRTLVLEGCQLRALPDWIGGMQNLETLELGGNQLESLSSSVGMLASLRRLGLRDNRLTTLPRNIEGIGAHLSLSLHGNPLDAPTKSWMQETFGVRAEGTKQPAQY
jgi:hypothetical protein